MQFPTIFPTCSAVGMAALLKFSHRIGRGSMSGLCRFLLSVTIAILFWLWAVPAVAAVSLAASSIEATTATLTITDHTGDWYYKYTSPSGGTCSTKQSGTTANLTQLSTGTTYTFKAYSNSSCSTVIATAADFLTKPGKPISVHAVGMDESIRITGIMGDVSYTHIVAQWKSGTKDWDATNRQKVKNKYFPGVPGERGNEITLTGLTNDTSYTVRIQLRNGTGDSAWSELATATPQADKKLYKTIIFEGRFGYYLSNYTGNWSAGYTTSPASDYEYCFARTAPRANVNVGKAHVEKTFIVTAYSDNSCTTRMKNGENDVPQLTVTLSKLTASNITSTGARLTLQNHSGPWYYRQDSPTSGSCTLGTNSYFDVSNLSANTSYTFRAYHNDSTCADGHVVATRTFPTLPPKPKKPTATAGVGSGKLKLTASVTGDGTLKKWQYRQKAKTDTNFGSWKDISSTSISLSYTVTTGLTDGTEYQFQVRAVNASGTGAISEASDAVAPAARTLEASEVEATTATLTIANHTGDWYYKYTSPSGGTCSSSAVSGKTKDLTDLSSNTSYTYEAYSDSSCSTNALASVTFLTKPTKPTKPTATAGAGSGKLTLAATITGGGTLTKWQYQQKASTDTDFGSWKNISSTLKTLNHTLSGLADGTNYQFKVRAVNETGDGAASDASTAIAPKDETLTASSVEATTATLTIDNYKGDWYFKANYAPNSSCSNSEVSNSSTDLANLSPNTSYTFKAYSDSSCSTELASAKAFLTKPGKPTTPTVTSKVGSGKLKLTASVTGDGTLTKWQYQQKSDTDTNFGSWKNISSMSTSLSYTVPGLTNGTNYQFKVRAVNATGNGAESGESTAVAPLAEKLTAGSVEATTATLTIANHTGDWYFKANAAPHASCSSKVSSTTKDLTGLSSNTSYTYKAYSDSNCSTTALASTSAFLTKPGQPGQPTAATGAGSGKLTLSASVSGNGKLTRWQYQQKTETDSDFGSWHDISSTSTSLSYTVADLTDGTEYQFKVRAVNSSGTGAVSDASAAVAPVPKTRPTKPTKPTKPGKPTTPTVTTGVGSGKLTLSASAFSSVSLTGWQYQQKSETDTDFGSWQDISSISTSLFYTVTGLTNGKTYQFKVRAMNSSGTGAESDASTAVAPLAETLTVSSVEATTATLTIANHVGDWYFKANAAPHTSCSSTAVSGATKDLTGLSSNTSYTYEAYGDSSCSTTALASTSAFLTKPGKPTLPTVTTGVGSGKLTLSASVSGSGALTGWQYQQKSETDTDFGPWQGISSTSTSLFYTVTGLTNGKTYQFKVRAMNSSGTGAESDASTAVAPLAETLTVSSVEATTATLTIANHVGDWYFKANAAPHTSCSSTAVSGATKDLTGLSSNTSYTYEAYGDSSCSTTALASTSAFLTKPGKPTLPTVTTGVGSGKLTLSASVSGSGALTGWQYQQKSETDTDFGPWQGISSTSTSLFYTVTGLTNGKTYQFKVRAMNSSGTGAESDASTAVAPLAETLTVSSVEATTATLTIANHMGDWYFKANAAPHTSCSSTAVSGATKDLTGLSSNTDYTYTAYSDSDCSTELASETFLTKPGKVTGVIVTLNGKLVVSWTAVPGGSGYRVQWKSDSEEWDTTNRQAATTDTLFEINVPNSTAVYTVRVAAVNDTGAGTWSDETTVALPAPGFSSSAATRWLAHFGTAVSVQTTDMIADRMDMSTKRGPSLLIGGQSVSLDNRMADSVTGYGTPSGHSYVELKRFPYRMEDDYSLGYRELTGKEIVAMSSFHLDSGEESPYGRWSAWGSGAQVSFEGGGDNQLQGDLTTAMVGTDYENGGLLAGVGLSHTLGDGSFDYKGRNEVETAITGVHPYLRYTVNDRLSLWGTVGLGEGKIALEVPDDDSEFETDIEMRTGAVGLRGELARNVGMDLAVKTDYAVTRMDSEKVVEFEAMSVKMGRFRVMLEASREISMTDGRLFTPSVEVLLRHDDGDADEGVGVELRGGIRYTDPDRRLTMKLAARRLVMHEENGVRTWGVSGLIRLNSDSSGQGLSLSVRPSIGTDGAERLWDIESASRSANENDAELSTRLSAEVGYGIGALGGLLTPYTSLSALEGDDATYRVGGRFSKDSRLNMNLGVDLKDNSEYGIALQGSIIW